MWIRDRVSTVILLLALVFLCGGLLWKLPALRAGQQSDKAPTATLLARSEEPRIIPVAQEASGLESEVRYKRFQKTQLALLKSRRVISAAFAEPGLSEIPAIKDRRDLFEWLADHLQASFQEESEVLSISLRPGTGLSTQEQARVVNAIQNAYMDEVVNVRQRERQDRLDQLKKSLQTNSELITTRRETIRKLAAEAGRGQPISGPIGDAVASRYHELRSLQVKLWLDQAEAEALLARRKKAEGAEAEQARKEIPELEDRLAAIAAQQKLIDGKLADLEKQSRTLTDNSSNVADLTEELKSTEATRAKIAAELEKLQIELQAPPRIVKFEEAVP
jgi:DNA repair exonuclease SbcCD ATPase subunit